MKLLWNTLGLFALLLAGAGVLLPLLPTTPFLLLASACFVQGSPRLHHWLHSNRVLGSYIRDFKEKRGIPLRSKIVAIAMLWASILFSAYRVRFVSLKVLLVAIAVGVSIYLLSQKTRAADGD